MITQREREMRRRRNPNLNGSAVALAVFLASIAAVGAAICPYDFESAARIIPAGCAANATAPATGCCWYVFASFLYAAIRHANRTGAAFLPEPTARACTTALSDRLVRRGLVPSVILSGDRCNLAGDPVKFAAGSRPCQFRRLSDLISAVDLSNATRYCARAPFDLTRDQPACVDCQDAVVAATFALFDATRSREIVPCGMAATMGIWASSVPDPARFTSYVLCLVQILENVGNLGAASFVPSPPPSSSHRTTKIAAGSAAVILVLSAAFFLVLCLVRRRRMTGGPDGMTTDMDLTSAIQRPLPTAGLYVFSKAELRRATGGFHVRNLLGEGGAGKVYLGVLPSGQHVAVKRIHRKKKKLGEFYREVEVISKLRHRRLATLVGYCLQPNNHALVYEYMPGGNLAAALRRGQLTWWRRLQIAADVAEGLAYLHQLHDGCVVHRDVKPNNVLLADDGRGKLSDFGVAKVVPPELTHVSTGVKGTRGYVDPEYFADGHVSVAADVYSFGVMLLQVISGSRAVVETPSGGQESIVQAVRGGGGAAGIVDRRLAAEFADCGGSSFEEVFALAARCVMPEKSRRPKMADVLAELRRVLAELESCPRDSPLSVTAAATSPTSAGDPFSSSTF
ncbi:uncharacterized protein LOC144715604 [Wolffia australiana]